MQGVLQSMMMYMLFTRYTNTLVDYIRDYITSCTYTLLPDTQPPAPLSDRHPCARVRLEQAVPRRPLPVARGGDAAGRLAGRRGGHPAGHVGCAGVTCREGRAYVWVVPRPACAVCCVHPNCPVHPYLPQHSPTRHCALCALRSTPHPPKRLGACVLPGDSSTPTPCALCAVSNAHSEKKCSWTVWQPPRVRRSNAVHCLPGKQGRVTAVS